MLFYAVGIFASGLLRALDTLSRSRCGFRRPRRLRHSVIQRTLAGDILNRAVDGAPRSRRAIVIACVRNRSRSGPVSQSLSASAQLSGCRWCCTSDSGYLQMLKIVRPSCSAGEANMVNLEGNIICVLEKFGATAWRDRSRLGDSFRAFT